MVTHGPSTGTYREKPIPAWIVEDGLIYDFERTVLGDESVTLSNLAEGECVIYPGLVYRLAEGQD